MQMQVQVQVKSKSRQCYAPCALVSWLGLVVRVFCFCRLRLSGCSPFLFVFVSSLPRHFNTNTLNTTLFICFAKLRACARCFKLQVLSKIGKSENGQANSISILNSRFAFQIGISSPSPFPLRLLLHLRAIRRVDLRSG